jgi:hypothetical protein
MRVKLVVVLAIVLLGALVVGCAYNHKNFDPTRSPMAGEDNFVIQLDDYGQFWDRKPADEAIARITSLAQRTNVIVLLFVHGWNHDAAPDNEDLRDFAKALGDARRLLIDVDNPESEVYRLSRLKLTDIEDLTIVGIYVGWRGRSLPSFLNYATFWGRKATAERVGQGDLREFLFNLNSIYRERRELRAKGVQKHFMGLASTGHSFGAQVLFKSVAHEIENELILATRQGLKTEPPARESVQLIGFGDLVVLLNPAFESLQFERIRRLSDKLTYSKYQSPVVLVVSSAGDVPRQVLFPFGRSLDALFRPSFREGQKSLWTEALGEYEPFRTHSLEILPEGATAPRFDPEWYLSKRCAIATYDLSNVPKIQGVSLVPTTRHSPNNPFLVAYASTDVVLNHTEIFKDELIKFLFDYVAIAQGKRMVTGDPLLKCD